MLKQKPQNLRKIQKKFEPEKFSLDFTKKTCIMGILNRTPDSFSDGGFFMDKEKAFSHIYKMVDEGADIIDIGGQSTRPGSRPVGRAEELERVIPVIEGLRGKIGVPISLDTYNSYVAEEGLKRGVSIINDITGLNGDRNMPKVIAKYNAGVILMHMQGEPWNMQDNPQYENLIGEIKEYLKNSIDVAEEAGISPDKIIIDPGIGFGKGPEHNLEIIRNIKSLKSLGKPILVGVSRKSFIGKILERDLGDRIFGTAAACAAAIVNGADIIRVHDCAQMRDVSRMLDAILEKKEI